MPADSRPKENPPIPENRSRTRTGRLQVEIVPVDTITDRLDVDGFFVQRVLIVLIGHAGNQYNKQKGEWVT
jgi:hypothetical protein